MKTTVVSVLVALLAPVCSFAQEKASTEELAKKLSNPIASLISVPFQNNTDYGIGPNNATRNTMNFQPVIPIGLGEKLNLITRVILPVITQYDVTGEGRKENGVGDITASAFFSPKSTGGFTWGAGPAFLIPTGSDDLLTAGKFGIGPTAIVLSQNKGWTYGLLANQIWSVAGEEDYPDVNQLFLQPFLVHNWKSGAGAGINLEMTQNWEAGTTTLWINPTVSGVTSIGTQKISLSVGPRLNAAAAAGHQADWGWRAVLVLVFRE